MKTIKEHYAFPLSGYSAKQIELGFGASPWSTGLTKREYFALEVMQSILSTVPTKDLLYTVEDLFPRVAVMYADMLIKELNKDE